MQSEEQFEIFVRAGLARFGIDVEEAEMQVIRFADQMYGPHLDALMAADLSDVEPEAPSIPPARRCPPPRRRGPSLHDHPQDLSLREQARADRRRRAGRDRVAGGARLRASPSAIRR